LTKADVREPANPSALVSQTTTLFAKVDTTFGNDLGGKAGMRVVWQPRPGRRFRIGGNGAGLDAPVRLESRSARRGRLTNHRECHIADTKSA